MDETKPFGLIYKITSPSGKVYIGQTKNTLEKRMGSYRRLECDRQPKIHAAIVKYGWGKMGYECLEFCCSAEELNKRENDLIKQFDSINKGYNCVDGGESFFSTQYFKDKNRGRSYKRKNKNKTERMPCHEETKAKIRKAHKERWKDGRGKASIDKMAALKRNITIFEFFNLETNEIFIGDSTSFGEKIGRRASCVLKMINRKVFSIYGWILYQDRFSSIASEKSATYLNKIKKHKYRNTISGETFEGTQTEFRKRFSFTKSGVSKFSLGKLPKYKNWIVVDFLPEKT